MPEGLSPRGGKESPAHEVRDLLDRRLARESGRLPVAPSARLAGDRRDVELVDAGTQAHPSCRTVLTRRLADQHCHVGALDSSEEIDDPFRVRLRGADLGAI